MSGGSQKRSKPEQPSVTGLNLVMGPSPGPFDDLSTKELIEKFKTINAEVKRRIGLECNTKLREVVGRADVTFVVDDDSSVILTIQKKFGIRVGSVSFVYDEVNDVIGGYSLSSKGPLPFVLKRSDLANSNVKNILEKWPQVKEIFEWGQDQLK